MNTFSRFPVAAFTVALLTLLFIACVFDSSDSNPWKVRDSGTEHDLEAVVWADTQAVAAPRNDMQANADLRNDARSNPAPADSAVAQNGPLFPEDELHNFRARWNQAQTSFVDEPRKAVEQADSLVANVVSRLAEQFSNERAKLEEQWSKGDDVNTEDLRQALRRYRSFFDRLLSL